MAKHEAKRVIHRAQERERKKFGDMLEEENGKGAVLRVVRQMVGIIEMMWKKGV